MVLLLYTYTGAFRSMVICFESVRATVAAAPAFVAVVLTLASLLPFRSM